MKQQITLEQIISELGEIPLCQCDECQKTQTKVNVKLDRNSYKRYKRKGYDKFIVGHSSRGKNNPMKRPEVVAKFIGDLNSSKRPEVRQKLVDMWKDQELRERACRANSESWTQEKKEIYSKQMKENNLMETEEIKIKHLESVNTIEYKTKMSELTKESWITNPKIKNCGKNSYFYGKPPKHGKVYIYQSPLQGEVKLIGSYEYKYVLYLDSNNIPWYYEHKIFPLILNGRDTTYTPDFYLPETDEFVEIKGYWRDDAKEKFELFLKTYPEIKIKLLFGRDLKNLGIKI